MAYNSDVLSDAIGPQAGVAQYDIFGGAGYGGDVGTAPVLPGNQGSWWDKMMGDSKTPGRLAQGVSAFSGLAQAYTGLKQYGLAKDTFRQNRREWGLNYDAQRQLTNSRMRDRQNARVASNPGAYQSVNDYMAQNEVAARG